MDTQSMNTHIVVTTRSELEDIIRGIVRDALAGGHKKDGTLDERQAAALLGLSPATLRRWRSDRQGPAYIKAGRSVLYAREDIDRWLLRQRVLTAESPLTIGRDAR